MKLISLLMVGALLLFGQDKGNATQQATNCSQNFGPGSRNNTGRITCYGVDKKLAAEISEIIATSKRDGKTLKDLSDKIEIVLREFQNSQSNTTVIQQAPNGINIGPGANALNAQVNNITAAQLNINTMSPGLGMLLKQRVPYQPTPSVFLSNGQRIDATAKTPGTLYVVVILSDGTQSNITDKQSHVDSVLEKLRALPGVTVFYVPGSPAYTLVKHDRATTIGGSLTINPKVDSLYFFDPVMEMQAKRVKDALGDSIERTQLWRVPNSDGGVYADTLATSGADMELFL
jgi:hypothetical protein